MGKPARGGGGGETVGVRGGLGSFEVGPKGQRVSCDACGDKHIRMEALRRIRLPPHITLIRPHGMD